MKGKHAFCPRTGAPLSEERHYDEYGRAQRAPLEGRLPDGIEPTGALTSGESRSSTTALVTYFRRCHGTHADSDDDLYRSAALAVRRLKDAADGEDEWDVHVWYALAERLARKGYDVEWMHAHATPRCPNCHGPLQYEAVGDSVVGRCATACTGRHDRLDQIRSTLVSLYNSAFAPDDPLETGDLTVVGGSSDTPR